MIIKYSYQCNIQTLKIIIIKNTHNLNRKLMLKKIWFFVERNVRVFQNRFDDIITIFFSFNNFITIIQHFFNNLSTIFWKFVNNDNLLITNFC